MRGSRFTCRNRSAVIIASRVRFMMGLLRRWIAVRGNLNCRLSWFKVICWTHELRSGVSEAQKIFNKERGEEVKAYSLEALNYYFVTYAFSVNVPKAKL